MQNVPKVPNLRPQPSAPEKGKNVVWMSCRARAHCEGKYAKLTLTKTNSTMAGGGTWRRYQCESCGGVWTLTH
jgi:hypothetical protein